MPTDDLIARYEAQRAASGRTVTQALSSENFSTAIAGTNVQTWGYNGALNGPTIRAQAGDLLSVQLKNSLSEATSIHWHGLALRNNADGVPDVTQKAVAAGVDYNYSFLAPDPGTYWYHSHVEMQRERALYGALIIEDPKEPLSYDREWVVILDDWVDGMPGTPDELLASISGMSGMKMGGESGMLMGASSNYLAGDAGDVKIPVHLFNGKSADAPDRLEAKRGDRIRLRIINAAGDTAYRVGLQNQQITLTHADGFPVQQVDVDAVVLGMGERIDALLTVTQDHTALFALAEGKGGGAMGIISVGASTADIPSPPVTLSGTVTDGGRLRGDESVLLPTKTVDRVIDMQLTGGMMMYDWGINGRRFDPTAPFAGAFDIRVNERVRVNINNSTLMWHPMHLHGHTFQLDNAGARKDTVIVRPGETVSFEFDANNPGQWLTHCHNAYHAARGMMGVFSYVQ
ncbi:multicopper oxidase family protein [Salinibacterium sp. G-O1]|uniref:multicopper oxidase family protein n=1 Tax=Salinibacterium sp. G-O1 TaxID=3046208 RepID=UPI0032D9A6DC